MSSGSRLMEAKGMGKGTPDTPAPSYSVALREPPLQWQCGGRGNYPQELPWKTRQEAFLRSVIQCFPFFFFFQTVRDNEIVSRKSNVVVLEELRNFLPWSVCLGLFFYFLSLWRERKKENMVWSNPDSNYMSHHHGFGPCLRFSLGSAAQRPPNLHCTSTPPFTHIVCIWLCLHCKMYIIDQMIGMAVPPCARRYFRPSSGEPTSWNARV